MRRPGADQAAHQELDQGKDDAPISNAEVAPPQDHRESWRPVGTVLERAFQALDFTPTADADDPAWKHWHARPGDLVEILDARREVLSRHFVRSASPAYLKLDDRRVFEQRGWPVVSGRKSPIRWRKARHS
jgi:hypothetical protein